jgi:hypothetical protein
MTKKPRHSESLGKVEASAEGRASKMQDQAPMDRFTSLTRALLTVSNKQLRDEQARYERDKPRRGKRR